MEGPNGADGAVCGHTIAAQHIDADTGRVLAIDPCLFGVDFTTPTHPLPREVGGDPSAGLRPYTGATVDAVVREVEETSVSPEAQSSQGVAPLKRAGAFAKVDGLVVVVLRKVPGASDAPLMFMEV